MGTTAEKLTYLNTTKGKIKDSINLTGAGITTEPFRQYAVKLKDAYVDIINNGTETLYNNFPKVSGSGTDLSLQNTYEAPMQIDLKGNTSQEGTPTPDYPQDIHNVSGNNSIVVCGKNLFDKDNANVINGYIQASTAKIISGSSGIDEIIYIACEPNTTYTIQKIMNTPYNRNRFRIGTSSTIPANNTILDNFYRYDSDTQESGNPTEITYTTGENANYLVIYVWTLNGNYTFQQTLDTIQIEKGSTATTYEAYNGTTYPINLPSGMELCKIGTYQDYIYKEDDKWYLHKEIGKVVLDGTEADSDYGKGTTGSFTRFGYNPFMNTSLVKVQSDYVSNYFKYLGTIGGDTTEAGISNTSISNLNRLFIFLPTSLVSTISAFKTWLSTHNTIVYYALATPTNTEITDTTLLSQLEAIYNAKSKNGTTNISQENNDLPFNLTISALEKEQ